jgi:hypothetical protein
MTSETKNDNTPFKIPIHKDSKFRDEWGRLLYSRLFFERTIPSTRKKVIYTLKDQDHEGNSSLYQKYLEENDPTEYAFAASCFESYEHWLTLTRQLWFQPFLSRFRRDLETRIRSKALKAIIAESKTSSKNAFLANKYLLEKGWKDKVSIRGRPSTVDIANAARDILDDRKKTDEDYLRVIGK